MLMKLSNDLYAVSEDYLKNCGVFLEGYIEEMKNIEKDHKPTDDRIGDLLRQRKQLKMESIEYYNKMKVAEKFADEMFTENEQLKVRIKELEYMLSDKKAVSKVVREMEGGQWG